MIKVEVFIMTRNRPNTIMRAVDSVLHQTYKGIDIIVSDNSTNDETQLLLSNYSGKIKYLRRTPTFDSGIDHLNKIHTEATADYYMIFHDDDEMLPEMIVKLVELIERHQDATAVGSNAYRVYNGTPERMYFTSKEDIFIDSPDKLMSLYANDKIAPFPSYLYKNKKGLLLNKEHGGKYADVAFLASLCINGKIILCKEPLMNYNIHEGQDSHTCDFVQHMKLVNYLKKICIDKANLNGIRIRYIYAYMLQKTRVPVTSLSLKVLMKYSLFNYFFKYIIKKELKLL